MTIEIGDEIRVKSLDWFNFNNLGLSIIGSFANDMSKYCNSTAKIIYKEYSNNKYFYHLDIDDKGYYWQDYMFDYNFFIEKLDDYCINICPITNCSNDFCIYKKFKLNKTILNIGDEVKIRSTEWFEFNCINECIGRFYPEMSKYCNLTVTITDINRHPFLDVITYKLNIDNGEWDWQDYMFDLNYSTDEFFKRFCNCYCICECNNNCPIYNNKLKC